MALLVVAKGGRKLGKKDGEKVVLGKNINKYFLLHLKLGVAQCECLP